MKKCVIGLLVGGTISIVFLLAFDHVFPLENHSYTFAVIIGSLIGAICSLIGGLIGLFLNFK